MLSAIMHHSVYESILPREKVRTVDWAARNVIMPPGSEVKGPVDWTMFPHMVEPADELDNPEVEEVSCQFASRLGKTVLVLIRILKNARTDPRSMAFGDADVHSVKRVFDRGWKMLAKVPDLEIPPERLRGKTYLHGSNWEVRGAWSRSASSAADFPASEVYMNEIDKMWPKPTDGGKINKNMEADFPEILAQRAMGFSRFKLVRISTPALVGRSRIAKYRAQGDNRTRWVPCPHCNRFQRLRIGNGRDPGGIKYDKGPDGHGREDIARETAYYECEHCRKKILDSHRFEMMNAGVWIKEGQRITTRGRIEGKPLRSNRHASFGPLSTLYSLLPKVTWGWLAAQWVKALKDRSRAAMQHFINSILGEEYDPQPVIVQPHELIERLQTAEPARMAPPWSRFCTYFADVGRVSGELIFYWGTAAFGIPDEKKPAAWAGQLLDRGLILNSEEFVRHARLYQVPHADGGPPLRPVRWGVDSGWNPNSKEDVALNATNEVYNVCRAIGPYAFPTKGASKSDFLEMYRPGVQRAGVDEEEIKAKIERKAWDLILINTQRSQEWIEHLVTGVLKPGEPGHFTVPAEFCADHDWLNELLNDYQDELGRWKKRGANEGRDVLRGLMVMAWVFTKNGTRWQALPPRRWEPPAESKVIVPTRERFVAGGAIIR